MPDEIVHAERDTDILVSPRQNGEAGILAHQEKQVKTRQ